MTLQTLEQILKEVTPDVYELAAPKGLTRFVVYARSGGKYVPGDDEDQLDFAMVQLDIVTQSTEDTLEPLILGALRRSHIPFAILGVRFDWELNYWVTSYRVVI